MIPKTLITCMCLSYSLSLVCLEQKKPGQYKQLNPNTIELQTPTKPDQTKEEKTAAPEQSAMTDKKTDFKRIRAKEASQEYIDCAKDCGFCTAALICYVATCGSCAINAIGQDFEKCHKKEVEKRAQRKNVYAQLLEKHT